VAAEPGFEERVAFWLLGVSNMMLTAAAIRKSDTQSVTSEAKGKALAAFRGVIGLVNFIGAHPLSCRTVVERLVW
jgi:hypothetical protein